MQSKPGTRLRPKHGWGRLLYKLYPPAQAAQVHPKVRVALVHGLGSLDLGRDIHLLHEASRRTGVNIRREEARVDRPRPLPYTGFEEGTQAAEGKKTGVPFVSRTPRDARIMSDR